MKTTGAFIITGATGGLGSALAEVVYDAGYPVALIARSKPSLIALERQLRKRNPAGKGISLHSVDLRNEIKTKIEIKKAITKHGVARALVNNAGTWMGTTTVEKLKSSDIQASMGLNFFTAVNATTALLSSVGKKGGELAIINIGATSSLDAWMEVLPFCIAKGALKDFSRALARDLGPKGIHVAHCVIDGVLDTKRTRKLNQSLKSDRFINPDALARNILHIALQEKSCWTNEWDVRPYNENW